MSQFTIVMPDLKVVKKVTLPDGTILPWAYNDLDLSYVPTDVHAVEWDTSTNKGHVEKTDYSVEEITDLGIYQQTLTAFDTKFDDGPGNTTEPTDAQKLDDLRSTRTGLLSETDWMAGSDVTMSDAWKTYRQALRDLPANTSDWSNVTYPTEPSD